MKFSTTIVTLCFTQSKCDYSLFTKGCDSSFVALLVYVDDIVIASPSSSIIATVKTQLQSAFKLKDLGPLKYFLGLEVARSAKGIFLSQRKYILSLLEDSGFIGSKPASVPMDPNLKLTATDGDPLPDSSQYRRLIGRLLYLTISRPDITFAVNKLSQFMSNPLTPHLSVVHHLLRYLKSTPGQGILFSSKSSIRLQGYADADWGTCPDSRKSISGFCMFLGDSLISWKSKKQSTVARSSAEAEYRSLAAITSEISWL